MNRYRNRRNHLVLSAVLIAAALLSFFVLRPLMASPGFYQDLIRSLDAKKATVTGLLTVSTSASTALSLLPQDTATPLAQELAQLSTYFLIILSTLYMEKYLLPIFGAFFFGLALPVSLVLLAVCGYTDRAEFLKRFARKFLSFALIIFLVIPTSVYVSDSIERTWKDSMEGTFNAVQLEGETLEDEEPTSFLSRITNAAGSLVSGASEAVTWAKTLLNNLIESVAILTVTNCVIPIVVLLIYSQIIKNLFGGHLIKWSGEARRPYRPAEDYDEEREEALV